MKQLKYIVLFICCSFSVLLSAQHLTEAQQLELSAIAFQTEHPDWIEFREGLNITPKELFKKHANALGLISGSKMALVSSETDEIGMSHYKYQQYYQGYPIQGAEVIVHTRDGQLESINGKWARNLSLAHSKSANVGASEATALQTAMRYAGGDELFSPEMEEKGVQQKSASQAKGELVWQLRGDELVYNAKNLVLSWKFDLYVKTGESRRVFVAANSNKLVTFYPLSSNNCLMSGETHDEHAESPRVPRIAKNILDNNSCVQGSGDATWVQEDVNIYTTLENGTYVLKNDCWGFTIHLRNMNGSTSTVGATEFSDRGNTWFGDDDVAPMQSWWSIMRTVQLFKNKYGRNSYDNEGANVRLYNNSQFVDSNGDTYSNNASALNGTIRLGQGNSSSPNNDWNCLDIVAHEFTHDVTGSSAGLVYRGESGALNESFSDIFGELAEEYAYTGGADWYVGKDRGAIRELKDPKDYGDPDTYEGSKWKPTGSSDPDNGGVHTNSGVLNYCFYILAEGDSGKNDNDHRYNLEGIGIDKAGKIAYRALTTYLTSSDQYMDARNAFVKSAKDLYGSCSREVREVIAAFVAVGVGTIPAYFTWEDMTKRPNELAPFYGSIQVSKTFTLTAITSPFQAIPAITGSGVIRAGDKVIASGGFYPTNIIALNASSVIELRADDCESIYPSEKSMASSFVQKDSRAVSTTDRWPDLLEAEKLQGKDIVVYPNPTHSMTTIQFDLPTSKAVSLVVYSSTGKQVEVLLAEQLYQQGSHQLEFSVQAYPPGMYFVGLKAGTMSFKKKFIVQR